MFQGNLRYKEGDTWKTRSKSLKTDKKREAYRLLQAWMNEENAKARGEVGLGNLGSDTVYQVVSRYLESQFRKNELERSTYYNQTNYLNRTVKEKDIGNRIFTELTRQDIEKWVTQLSADGLSPYSVKIAFSIVRKTYAYYFRIEEIPKNPFDHVTKPKGGKSRVAFLDDEQLLNLIGMLNAFYDVGSWFWTAINLAVLTGMRRGEICGLRWNEVDLQTNTIRITTAIGQSNRAYAKPPKNESSIREFPISPQTNEVLAIRRQYVEERRGKLDGSWFVISDKDGFMHPLALSEEMIKFTREYELKDHYGNYVTLHSLRHNFATMGVKSKVDIAALAHMLGHSDVAMTLNTYATADPQSMQSAVDSMGEAWRTTNPDIYYAVEYDEDDSEEGSAANDSD